MRAPGRADGEVRTRPDDSARLGTFRGSHTAAELPRFAHAGLAVGYALLAGLSIVLARQQGHVATIWYANALVVAALLATAPRRWPGLLLAAVAGNLLANLAAGDPLRLAASFVPANLAEVLLAAWLLRRQGLHHRGLRSTASWSRMLLSGALLPQVLGATVGAVLLAWQGFSPFGRVWLSWFEGSAIGALSVLPLALVAVQAGPHKVLRALGEARTVLVALLGTGVALVALAELPFPFVCLALPLLVGAVELGLAGAMWVNLIVSLTVAAALALGVFVPPPVTAEWQHVYVSLAFATALIPAQLVAAAAADVRDSRARLAARTDELRRANEGLEQFVHMAAHDLREPLNTIVQFDGLILQDHGEALPPDARQYLELSRRAAERMKRLLDDVLHYARLRGSAADLTQAVSLDEVLAEAALALAARVRDSGATLDIAPLPHAAGHPALLGVLFQNLLSNALKFVPPGRAPLVRVTGEQREGRVIVTVADNGIGIAPADQARLFKPFQRLHLRRDYDGTGLGLALCRQVVDAHRGRLTVESAAGEGARFIVDLPAG